MGNKLKNYFCFKRAETKEVFKFKHFLVEKSIDIMIENLLIMYIDTCT